ncbi:MAG: hypothetical protein AB1847_08280 [bacterium]
MRKKVKNIISLLFVCILISCISCLAGADSAFADREFQTQEKETSYVQASTESDTPIPQITMLDLFETFATLREDFIDILDYFNPTRAEQMGQYNDLIRDVLKMMGHLPRKTLP